MNKREIWHNTSDSWDGYYDTEVLTACGIRNPTHNGFQRDTYNWEKVTCKNCLKVKRNV